MKFIKHEGDLFKIEFDHDELAILRGALSRALSGPKDEDADSFLKRFGWNARAAAPRPDEVRALRDGLKVMR